MTALGHQKIDRAELRELRAQVLRAAAAAGFTLSFAAKEDISLSTSPDLLRVELAICERAAREGWFR